MSRKCSKANSGPSQKDAIALPKVVKDARFRAGRTLVRNGQASKAVDIFATLLEEARNKFGDEHFETCPAYYEYGNALFRLSNRRKLNEIDSEEQTTNDLVQSSERRQQENCFKKQMREAAASAASRRASNKKASTSSDGKGNSSIKSDEPTKVRSDIDAIQPVNDFPLSKDANDSSSEIDDDIQLSLEIMETAWAILDECQQTNPEDMANLYSEWIREQVPRILTGIGDVLSSLQRHADAADAYSRALEYREESLENQFTTDSEKQTVEYLTCRRLIVESNVLIAEELLACPSDLDVITTESKSVLVRASEGVIDYARGYYDKARDALQETVLLMGQLSASGVDIGTEKEDICFAATMVMGVGTNLAEIDEQNETTSEPMKKKLTPEK